MSRSKARREIRKFFIGLVLIIGVFIYNNYLQEPINELLEKLDPNYIENTDVKISLTMPHDREDFDKDKFIEDYSIEEYRKYITTKSVKGNIKFKIKE